MRTIAGAIIVLAAAILFGAGAIAHTIIEGAPRGQSPAGQWAMGAGALMGFLGFALLVAGLRSDFTRPPDHP